MSARSSFSATRTAGPTRRGARARPGSRAPGAPALRGARGCSVEPLEGRLLLTAFTKTSPTAGGVLPAGVTEVGGVVLDIIGQNDVRVVSQLSASSLFEGFYDTGNPAAYRGNPGTIGIQSGFTPAVVGALGGGIKELAVRITLFDGDTGPGNFDDNQNTLLVNGFTMGNFSDVVTQQTSANGLTLISSNPGGGFRDNILDTGFFFSNNATFLANLFASLGGGTVTLKVNDPDPYDNFYDFTQGVDGGLINVGQPPNVAPIISSASNDGPVDEGSAVTVTVTATDPDATAGGLTYLFDFDNNGTYEVSNTTGVAAHTYADNGSYTVPVRVTDAAGGVANSSTTVVVDNVDPALTSASSSAAECGDAGEGDSVTVSGAFTDPGTLDTHTVSIDWGDGNTSAATVNESGGSGSYSGSHAYSTGGLYTITVVVTDNDGGQASATVFAYVTGVGLVNGDQLHIIGTDGDDQASVERLEDGTFRVHADFLPGGALYRDVIPPTGGIARILAVMCDGADRMQIAGAITTPALIDGGAGDDHLNGGNGPNTVLGGAGDDMLLGGRSADLLIGGTGRDRIVGNAGDDLLIGGTTAFDDDYAALAAGPALTTADVSDDGAADALTGSQGSDWFYANAAGGGVLDKITDNAETLFEL